MRGFIDTKYRLMQTANELLWNSNYDNVGIAEICEKAGVTKGAFYHHFSSKADLFVSACASDWEQTRLNLDEVLSPRYNALEQLENMLALIVQKQVKENEEGRLYISGCPVFTAGAQAGCDCEEVRNVARDMSDNGARYFAVLSRNLSSEGYLNQAIEDETQMGRLMEQYVQGLMMHGRVHQDLGQLRKDLRAGTFRLLDVKEEYRVCEPIPMMQCKSLATG